MKKLTVFLSICCGINVFFSIFSTLSVVQLFRINEEIHKEIVKIESDVEALQEDD